MKEDIEAIAEKWASEQTAIFTMCDIFIGGYNAAIGKERKRISKAITDRIAKCNLAPYQGITKEYEDYAADMLTELLVEINLPTPPTT